MGKRLRSVCCVLLVFSVLFTSVAWFQSTRVYAKHTPTAEQVPHAAPPRSSSTRYMEVDEVPDLMKAEEEQQQHSKRELTFEHVKSAVSTPASDLIVELEEEEEKEEVEIPKRSNNDNDDDLGLDRVPPGTRLRATATVQIIKTRTPTQQIAERTPTEEEPEVTLTIDFETATLVVDNVTKTPSIPIVHNPTKVYFEMNTTMTVEHLMDMLTDVLEWNDTGVEMTPGSAPAPWLLITFNTKEFAAEAYDAGNTGRLQGISRAVYELPASNKTGSSFPIVAVVVPIVVVVVLAVVAVVVYCCLCRDRGGQGYGVKERYDEDYAMNYTTEPANLNDALIAHMDEMDEMDEDISELHDSFGQKPNPSEFSEISAYAPPRATR